MADYPTQKVLELACAAQRTYGAYLKESEYKHDIEGKFLFVKHANKDLVKYALGILNSSNVEQEFRPIDLILTPEDAVSAEEITKHFRKLMFSAVKGTSEFETEVNSILESETVSDRKIGYIACLPSVYLRDKDQTNLNRMLKACDDIALADTGATVHDKDCEILRAVRSKNFDAWNILAIIDNKIVSWMGKEAKVGPAVIQKAKVKGTGPNFQTKKIETRLNYVKVVQ